MNRDDAVLAAARRALEVEENKRGLRQLSATPHTFDELCDEWKRIRVVGKRIRTR